MSLLDDALKRRQVAEEKERKKAAGFLVDQAYERGDFVENEDDVLSALTPPEAPKAQGMQPGYFRSKLDQIKPLAPVPNPTMKPDGVDWPVMGATTTATIPQVTAPANPLPLPKLGRFTETAEALPALKPTPKPYTAPAGGLLTDRLKADLKATKPVQWTPANVSQEEGQRRANLALDIIRGKVDASTLSASDVPWEHFSWAANQDSFPVAGNRVYTDMAELARRGQTDKAYEYLKELNAASREKGRANAEAALSKPGFFTGFEQGTQSALAVTPTAQGRTVGEKAGQLTGQVIGAIGQIMGIGQEGGKAAGILAQKVAPALGKEGRLARLVLGAIQGFGTGATMGAFKEGVTQSTGRAEGDGWDAAKRIAGEGGEYAAYSAVYPIVKPGMEALTSKIAQALQSKPAGKAVISAVEKALPILGKDTAVQQSFKGVSPLTRAAKNTLGALGEAAKETVEGGTSGFVAGLTVGAGKALLNEIRNKGFDMERFVSNILTEGGQEASEEIVEGISLGIVQALSGGKLGGMSLRANSADAKTQQANVQNPLSNVTTQAPTKTAAPVNETPWRMDAVAGMEPADIAQVLSKGTPGQMQATLQTLPYQKAQAVLSILNGRTPTPVQASTAQQAPQNPGVPRQASVNQGAPQMDRAAFLSQYLPDMPEADRVNWLNRTAKMSDERFVQATGTMAKVKGMTAATVQQTPAVQPAPTPATATEQVAATSTVEPTQTETPATQQVEPPKSSPSAGELERPGKTYVDALEELTEASFAGKLSLEDVRPILDAYPDDVMPDLERATKYYDPKFGAVRQVIRERMERIRQNPPDEQGGAATGPTPNPSGNGPAGGPNVGPTQGPTTPGQGSSQSGKGPIGPVAQAAPAELASQPKDYSVLNDDDIRTAVRNPNRTVSDEEVMAIRKEGIQRGIVTKLEADLSPEEQERLEEARRAVSAARGRADSTRVEAQRRDYNPWFRKEKEALLREAEARAASAEQALWKLGQEFGVRPYAKWLYINPETGASKGEAQPKASPATSPAIEPKAQEGAQPEPVSTRLPDDQAQAELERLKALQTKTDEDWKQIGLLSHRLKGVTAEVSESPEGMSIKFSGPISGSLTRAIGRAGFRFDGNTKLWNAKTVTDETRAMAAEVTQEMGSGGAPTQTAAPTTQPSVQNREELIAEAPATASAPQTEPEPDFITKQNQLKAEVRKAAAKLAPKNERFPNDAAAAVSFLSTDGKPVNADNLMPLLDGVKAETARRLAILLEKNTAVADAISAYRAAVQNEQETQRVRRDSGQSTTNQQAEAPENSTLTEAQKQTIEGMKGRQEKSGLTIHRVVRLKAGQVRVEYQRPDGLQNAIAILVDGGTMGGQGNWAKPDEIAEVIEDLSHPNQTTEPKAEESKPVESTLPIPVSPDDIPYQVAYNAYSGMSFEPERRAKQVQEGYVESIQAVYNELAPLAKTEEQKQLLASELQRYKEGYLVKYRALLAAKSRTLSPMITGPSKFPVARNEKALNAEDKRREEFLTWEKKARSAIREKLAPAEARVISSDDADAVTKLQEKVASLEKLQETMKAANKIVRAKGLTDDEKVSQLMALGLKEKNARAALEPDFMGRLGFADYQLTNNNAEIRRLKGRIEQLQVKRSQQTTEFEGEKGRVVDSVEDNRVQLFFDGRPTPEVKKELAQSGFRWAPSIGAWQQYRSDRALQIARRLMGVQDAPAATTMEETQPEATPSTTQSQPSVVEEAPSQSVEEKPVGAEQPVKVQTSTRDREVLTKQARTGQKIRIVIREQLPGRYLTLAYADGKVVASGNVEKLDRPQGDITHVVQSGKIGVGLTASEADVVRQAIAEAETKYAMSPAGRMEALRRERDNLVVAISGAEAQAKADFDRLHARQDEGAWQAKAEGEAKVRKMSEALRRWDTAHPEVIARIQADADERTREFLGESPAMTGDSKPTPPTPSQSVEQGKKETPVTPDLQEQDGEKPAAQSQGEESAATEPTKTPEPLATGNTATVKTERGTAVDTQYAVVDASDLISSHDTGLRVDPRYPVELQPRDRSRTASEDQINRILGNLEPSFLGESPKASEGAPIVGPDLVVESGNGRVIALKRGYENNAVKMETYKQWLSENADRFGLDRAAIEKANAPILVRVRRTDVDRAQFASEANEQATAAMSATEQAMADAKRFDAGLMFHFNPTENGEIIHPGNRPFVISFLQRVIGPTEQGRYLTSDGQLSQEGIARIRNAVFARVYGDPVAIEKLAESPDNNVRNITNAMLTAAGRLVEMKDGIAQGRLFDVDPTEEIALAMRKLSYLREQGQKVEEYLHPTQMSFFMDDMPELALDILEVFNKHKQSPKTISSILRNYAAIAEAAGDPRQQTVFTRVQPTKAEVWAAAIRRTEANPDGVQATLFEGERGSSERTGASTGQAGPGAQASGTAGEGQGQNAGQNGSLGFNLRDALSEERGSFSMPWGRQQNQSDPLTEEIDQSISYNDQKGFKERYGSPKEATHTATNWIVDEFFDSNDAVRRMQKTLAGNQELSADTDAYLRLSILPKLVPGRTEAKLQEMQGALQPLGEKLKDYFRYADAKETLWRSQQFGYTFDEGKLPMKPEAAQKFVDRVEQGPDANLFRTAYNAEQNLYDNMLAELKDAGMLSDEAIRKMRAAYGEKDAQGNIVQMHYVPFFRDMSAETDAAGNEVRTKDQRGTTGQGRTPVNVPKATNRQKGSNRKLMDPMERRIRYISRVTGVAERNKVGMTLAKFVEQFDPNGDFMTKVAPPMEHVEKSINDLMTQLEDLGFDPSDLADPNGTIEFFKPKWARGRNDSIVTIWQDGKAAYYDVKDKGVFDAIAGMDPTTSNIVSSVLEKATTLYKTGATITPGFTISNLIRDTAESYILSHNQVYPGQAFVEAMRLLRSKDPFVQRVIDAGLKQGGWLRPEKLSVDMAREIADPRGATLSFKGLFDLYQKVREEPEFWTRLGEASLEYKERIKKGDPDEAAFLRAMYEGGRITLNFTRAGKTARAVNKFVPFFKIPLEAGYRTYESARENTRPVYDPRSFWFKAIVPATAFALATVLLGKDDEQYQEASEAERDRYMLIPIGRGLLRIPKPNGIFGIAQNLVERSLRQWATDEPEAFHDFIKSAANDLFPRVGSGVLDLVVAVATGYSMEDARPIVPARMEKLSPERQTDSYTSEAVKSVGAPVLGNVPGLSRLRSPLVAQYAIDKALPGYSQGFFALEKWAKRVRASVNPGSVSAAPVRAEDFVGRFYTRPGETKQGRSVDLFYDKMAKADQVYNDLRDEIEKQSGRKVTMDDLTSQQKAIQTRIVAAMDPEDKALLQRRKMYSKVSDTLSTLRQQRDRIQETTTMNAQAKDAALREINRKMTELARKVVGE